MKSGLTRDGAYLCLFDKKGGEVYNIEICDSISIIHKEILLLYLRLLQCI